MAGTKYYVDIVYRTTGDPAGGAEKIGEKAQKAAKVAKESWSDTASSMLAGFTGVVEKAGALAISLGEAGLAAGVSAVTYGVVGLNKELETTQVSLAAVLNANGQSTGGIEGAMEASAKWVRQMKVDARELPGEFEELLTIVQTSAGSAFKLGLDPQRFEKLAANTMAASKALAVETHQAGRELAMLFEGRAGTHNVLAMRLGIDAHAMYADIDKAKKSFHDLSDEGRAKLIEQKIGAFEPAIRAFAGTYDAQFSTLVDNLKGSLGTATKELFGRVVGDLTDINAWFDRNRGDIEAWAKSIAHDLVDLHDRVRRTAEEWMPILKEFGENAYKKFGELWREAEPYVRAIAEHIKDFFKDKDAVEKLTTLLKLYVAAKTAQAIGGPLGAIAKGAGGAGLAGEGAALATTGAGAAAVAGVGLAAWQAKELGNDVQTYADERWTQARSMARVLSDQQGGMIDYSSKAYVETLVDAAEAHRGFKEQLLHEMDALAHWDLEALTTHSTEAAMALQDFAIGLQNTDVAMQQALEKFKKEEADAQTQRILDDSLKWTNKMAQDFLHGKMMEDEAAKKRKKDTEGKMVINGNIYFTITSNQNPGQIAREVQRQLIEKRRFPTTSPHTRNFAVARSTRT